MGGKLEESGKVIHFLKGESLTGQGFRARALDLIQRCAGGRWESLRRFGRDGDGRVLAGAFKRVRY